jgi:drug/metabolite transporter (DMT)-like permease
MLETPAGLLIIVGALLGANFPIGKIASGAGVPGLVWAALLSVSAASVLGLWVFLRGRQVPVDGHHLRYFTVTALTAYAVPNTLVFAAIPHLGAGLTSIFYALSPIVTLALAAVAGLRKPSPLELAGIAVGFAGALMVVSGRGEIGKPADIIWLAAGFMVPVSLALGNVYRTLDWPDNADPLWLAVGSHIVAGLILSGLALFLFNGNEIARAADVPGAALAQAVASSLMLPLFFRLQRVGGPVTLSQIGIVAAAVGVGIGAFVLGERYATIVWLGVAVIAIGVTLTVLARIRDEQTGKSAVEPVAWNSHQSMKRNDP